MTPRLMTLLLTTALLAGCASGPDWVSVPAPITPAEQAEVKCRQAVSEMRLAGLLAPRVGPFAADPERTAMDAWYGPKRIQAIMTPRLLTLLFTTALLLGSFTPQAVAGCTGYAGPGGRVPTGRAVDCPTGRAVDCPPARVVDAPTVRAAASPPAQVVGVPTDRVAGFRVAQVVGVPTGRVVASPLAQVAGAPTVPAVGSPPVRMTVRSPASRANGIGPPFVSNWSAQP